MTKGKYEKVVQDVCTVQSGYLQQVCFDELGPSHAWGLVELWLKQNGNVLGGGGLLISQTGLGLPQLRGLHTRIAVKRRSWQHHRRLRQAAWMHECLLRPEGKQMWRIRRQKQHYINIAEQSGHLWDLTCKAEEKNWTGPAVVRLVDRCWVPAEPGVCVGAEAGLEAERRWEWESAALLSAVRHGKDNSWLPAFDFMQPCLWSKNIPPGRDQAGSPAAGQWKGEPDEGGGYWRGG